MIVLYQFSTAFGLPNTSPFCMKVENYLRMAKLPYQIIYTNDVRKAPKGKLPYIEDNGLVIADSGLIIDYLKRTYGDTLDAHLTAEQRAVSLAFTRLMDEHLYWAAGIQPRWLEEDGWKIIRPVFFQDLPVPLRFIIPLVARYSIKKQIYGHGLGRHNKAEIAGMACDDITALADFLGDKAFFHGAQVSSLDAVAYAYLANIIWPPIASAAQQHALALPNLVAFCQRMKATYYAD